MALTKVADIPQNILDIYSRMLITEQMPNVMFRQFVDYKLEFGMQPGERIKFIKLDNLPSGGILLDEETPIPKHKMSGSEMFISLYEFGNATSFSRRAGEASIRSLMDDAKFLLGRDYANVMDNYLRDTFGLTANKWYAKADGSNGTANSDINTGFTDDVLDSLVENAKNLLIPKFRRGGQEFYVFVGTPRQIRQIRNSDKWLDARRYVDPTQMLSGEAGRLEGVVFLDSTRMNDLIIANASSTSTDVHRGFFIGANAVGYGESVPMELKVDGTEDFGRKIALAWYAIAGAGIVNDYLIDVRTGA